MLLTPPFLSLLAVGNVAAFDMDNPEVGWL